VFDDKGTGIRYWIIIEHAIPGEGSPGFVSVPILPTKTSSGISPVGVEKFSSPVYIPVEAGQFITWRVLRDDPTAEGSGGLTITGVFMDLE